MDSSCESSSSDSPDYFLWDTWIQKKGRNKGFFRKPRISIGELKPDHKDISISVGSSKTEIFEGLVWGLPIYNKDWKIFSMNASGCRIEINIMKNNTSIYDQHIPLYWRRGKKLPEICSIDTMKGIETSREEYASGLPFAYMYALAGIASSTTLLPKGGKDESLFVFTYPEAQKIYMLPSLSIREDQVIHYSLLYNTKYDVLIKFRSKEYVMEKRFMLFAKSWNDVRFYSYFSEQVHKYWHCRRCPCRED